MNESRPPGGAVRVALPVYGSRVLPRFCLARCFRLAPADVADERDRVAERVWDPAVAPRLPRWLRELGVTGVICGGIHPRHRTALEAEGLWVAWGYRGEVHEVLAHWREGRPGEPETWRCRRRGKPETRRRVRP